MRILILIILLNSIVALTVKGQNDSLRNYNNGKMLFQTNCAPCHGVHKEIVGPLLASITKKRDKQWLTAFIRNSQSVIASGNLDANFLFIKYNHQVMPSFHQLSESEIENILLYIKTESFNSSDEIMADKEILQQSNPTILHGRILFQAQCSPCHFIFHEGSYGPALGSVTKRRSQEWLVPFINNSQKVINLGDSYAINIFNAFDQRIMVSMEFLNEDEIVSILNYIEFTSASDHVKAGVNGRNKPATAVMSNPETLPTDTQGEKSFFKILFIVIATMGACIHGYLIMQLFKYLKT